MSKINKITGAATQALEVVAKKANVLAEKPVVDYEKFSESQKLLSESVSSQGKAFVNMNKAKNEVKQKAITEGLATARKVVKSAPLPKNGKSKILGDINCKIEKRYLEQGLSGKSAQDSAEVILEQKPVDLVAKKEELLAKHGQKFEVKKQQEAQEACKAKQEKALQTAIRNLRSDFMHDTREFTNLFREIEIRIPSKNIKDYINIDNYSQYWEALSQVRAKTRNMTQFTYEVAEHVGKVFTDKGLIFAKEVLSNISDEEVNPRVKSCFMSVINGELENRVTLKGLEERDIEKVKKAFLEVDEKKLGAYQADLADHLAKRKDELMSKYGEELAKRPARQSAKIIQELDPIDLGAKKIELRKKFGNQTIIKSFMLEKNLNHKEAQELFFDKVESNAQRWGVSIEEAENIMEKRALAVIDVYTQMGQTI